jgi:hypothetical protein
LPEKCLAAVSIVGIGAAAVIGIAIAFLVFQHIRKYKVISKSSLPGNFHLYRPFNFQQATPKISKKKKKKIF